MLRVPLILGTATPTLESWRRVDEKQDVLLSMPHRVNGLPLPPVSIIDIRQDNDVQRGAAIGRQLANGMNTALKEKGQVILFLNLRGFFDNHLVVARVANRRSVPNVISH